MIATQRVRITLKKSLIGRKARHRATVRGLGLRKTNSSSELVLTPEVKGMIYQVRYLLNVEIL